MAIVQVSKIIHRSGNIDSLPQLDGAEFGLAVDYTTVPGTALNRLFIGPIVPVVSNSAPIANNIEILTQYSSVTGIRNGNTSAGIPVANGNITMSVAGNANVVVVTGTGANVNGYLTVAGPINVAAVGSRGDNSFVPPTPAASGVSPFTVTSTRTVTNLFADGAERANVRLATADANVYHLTFTSNAVETYAANAGSFTGDKQLYANSGVTFTVGGPGACVLTVDGRINPTAGISNAGNTTGLNPATGTVYGTWTLAPGASFQATYADLAEYYVADAEYQSGTVLEFGGEFEVTIAQDETTRVAGVVSTNPAYGMNANCNGEHVVALALQGRVPCRVRGNIRKGDMMCSGGDGYARPTHNPKIGTIIGKALENFSGEGIIEVAVGRL